MGGICTPARPGHVRPHTCATTAASDPRVTKAYTMLEKGMLGSRPASTHYIVSTRGRLDPAVQFHAIKSTQATEAHPFLPHAHPEVPRPLFVGLSSAASRVLAICL